MENLFKGRSVTFHQQLLSQDNTFYGFTLIVSRPEITVRIKQYMKTKQNFLLTLDMRAIT